MRVEGLGIYYYSYDGFTHALVTALLPRLQARVPEQPVHRERLTPLSEANRGTHCGPGLSWSAGGHTPHP